MRLSWKDFFTTLVAIAVGVGLVAGVLNYDWSLFGTWKGAVGTMGALGVLMLIFDETDLERINAWSIVEWIIVLAGVGLAIAGLIVASKVLFVLLAADVLTFWVTSIARHTLSHEPDMPREMFPIS